MQKFLQVFILASSVLIFSTSLALTLSQTVAKREAPTPTPTSNVYLDQEGNPKYAEGSCTTDSDCFVGGCSSEFCSTNQQAISSCIYSPDFPNPEVYRCGCWEQSCAWIER